RAIDFFKLILYPATLLKFFYMVYYIDRLSYVEPSFHLWDKAYLIMVNNVFDVFLESVCQYFIEYFCINVPEEDWKKSNDAENCQRELRKLKFDSVISESRHNRLLKEKEQSLMTCQQLYKTLQEELTTKERQEEDTKRRISLAENELETTRTLLHKTQEEMFALKNERELMLAAHQKSIKQMQETLRQKLLSDDSWREKAEAELTKERARHLLELQEQALLFKEEAKLELDTEKEKHQEIIRKHRQEQEGLQMKIADLIEGATKDLRLEVASLQEKLNQSHSRHTEESNSKKKEIEDLKSLVAELECHLKQESRLRDSVSENLKKEVKQKSDELERVMLARTQLLQQFSQSQEENTFLQETVRRECEERFGLTEALSQAREQLLELRRSGGSLLCPLNKGTLTYPASAVSNHRERSNVKQNCGPGINTTSLHGLPKPSASATPDKFKKVISSGLPTLPQHRDRAQDALVLDFVCTLNYTCDISVCSCLMSVCEFEGALACLGAAAAFHSPFKPDAKATLLRICGDAIQKGLNNNNKSSDEIKAKIYENKDTL
ncbi:hypothetical protein STEG23_005340, partial [Scotinomys teguina]